MVGQKRGFTACCVCMCVYLRHAMPVSTPASQEGRQEVSLDAVCVCVCVHLHHACLCPHQLHGRAEKRITFAMPGLTLAKTTVGSADCHKDPSPKPLVQLLLKQQNSALHPQSMCALPHRPSPHLLRSFSGTTRSSEPRWAQEQGNALCCQAYVGWCFCAYSCDLVGLLLCL